MTAGELATFTFSASIASYAVGIGYFDLSYSQMNGYAVKSMGVSLIGEKTADNEIQVQAALSLEDGDGTVFSSSLTNVFVVVLAWVQSSSSGIYLAQTSNLCGGNQILDVGGNLVSSGSFVNSFSMAFAQGEAVLEVMTEVNATAHANGLLASGTTSMNDGSGNTSSCKEISAGILAVTEPEMGFEVMEVAFNGVQTYERQIVTFENDVSEVIAVLKSVDNAFPTAQNMASVFGGLMLGGPNRNEPAISIDQFNKKVVLIDSACSMYASGAAGGSTKNQLILLIIAKIVIV
jgi:hypothetical protein